MAESNCTDCKNVADFAGNYTECILLHRFIDWWWWRSKAPDDCPLKGDNNEQTD